MQFFYPPVQSIALARKNIIRQTVYYLPQRLDMDTSLFLTTINPLLRSTSVRGFWLVGFESFWVAFFLAKLTYLDYNSFPFHKFVSTELFSLVQTLPKSHTSNHGYTSIISVARV